MTDIATSLEGDDFDYPKSAPANRAERGPLDDQEAGSVKPSIDLGSLRVEPRRGLQMRLEVEKSTNRVVAATLEYQGSSVQVQPFAAPRSTGLWLGIREQISQQVVQKRLPGQCLRPVDLAAHRLEPLKIAFQVLDDLGVVLFLEEAADRVGHLHADGFDGAELGVVLADRLLNFAVARQGAAIL